ncbi:MAG: immunoglobulin domain-containing protein, partial [Verrucomicrobia bacterium]|nr:immunoglobulin domain-containing protein [Verrucomicrobiota bacterium]
FKTSDLTYVAAVGLPFQDLTFFDDGAPVVLRGNTLSLMSGAGMTEASRCVISSSGYAVFSQAAALYVFGAASSNQTTPTVTKVLRSSFASVTPAAVSSGGDGRISLDDVFVDAGGTLNLLSRSVHGVLRWSPQSRSFIAPIPLRGSPALSAYSGSSNRLILSYPDGTVTQISLGGDGVEHPLFNVTETLVSVFGLDDLTLVNMNRADVRAVFDGNGGLRSYGTWSPYSTLPRLWISGSRRLYSSTPFSPTVGIEYETVATTGLLGSPPTTNGASDISPPLRANAANTMILSADGKVWSTDLGLLGKLTNTVTDGTWLSDGLYTIRICAGGTELQQWSPVTYLPAGSLVLPGLPQRVFAISDTRLVVVTLAEGYTAIYLVDAGRNLVGSWTSATAMPSILSQPKNANFAVGGSVVLTVSAGGGATTYQWRRNGTPLAGQTSSALTLVGLTASDSGSVFDVVVGNQNGSVTSNSATITLASGKLPQAISFSPIGDRYYGDAPFTLSAASSSGLPVSFSLVSGPATLSNNTVTITGVGSIMIRASQSGDGTYDGAPVVERSITVWKAYAKITISGLSQVADGSPKPVTVTTVPTGLNLAVTYNGFTVAPNKAGSYLVVAVVNEANYQGTANATLLISSVGGGGGGGGGGGNSAPTIVTQPSSQAVTVGGTAVFSVGASGTPAPTYQWRRNGAPLSGQTGTTLTLSGVTLADSGTVFDVVVSNSVGSVTSNGATLIVSPAALPGRVFFGTLGSGGRFALYVRSSGEATLVGYLPNGRGSFVVKFTVGADGSFSTSLPVGTGGGVTGLAAAGGSVRAHATSLPLTGSIAGGSLSGTISSTGEALSGMAEPASGTTAAFAGLYEAPVLNSASGTMYFVVGASGTVMGASADAGSTTAAQGTIGADGDFTLGLGGTTLQGSINAGSGAVSGQVMANGSATGSFGGVSATTTHTDRLVNISTRGLVGDGDKAMIAGFVISGSQAKSVLVRASGPTLTSYGLSGAMDDPVLKIYRGQDVILSNDNWSTSADATLIASTASRVGGFAQQAGSKDAALITSLSPGVYSAQVTRADGSSTGVALVEVYDASNVPGAEEQKVINISTRGEVGTGEKIMIAGFVVSGNVPKRVLIRAIGPTLGGYGVTGTLADPLLKLYQGDTVIATNDDWGSVGTVASDAASQVGAFPLGAGSKDAALLLTLAPGVYSAQVSGVGGTTGVALIEVYEVP